MGAFPDDPTVRRNAALIRRVWDAWERQPLRELSAAVMLAVQLSAQGTGRGRK